MKSLFPILALLASFVILCLGHGLQSVLLPARAALENYSDPMLGLLMSAYYIGFMLGVFVGPRLISHVGHIHVFAAMASLACVVMLCYPLLDHYAAWIALRVVYGCCLVHLYTVMESWLNGISEPATRGKILSVYMILNLLAMGLGQLLFFSTEAGGFAMFSITAILFALALVPLLLSRTARPAHLDSPELFGIKKLYRVSPLGVTGVLIFGLAAGSYWGLSASYILHMRFSQAHIAWFMAASLFGGLFAQWPLGALSDRINRRWVILLASLVVCAASVSLAAMGQVQNPADYPGTGGLLACGALFGAGFHPLYALCLAHANDFVPREHVVRASTGLLLTQSVGAVIGPLCAGLLMQHYGHAMLYGFIAALFGGLALYALTRLLENRIPKQVQPFRLLTRTGAAAFLMSVPKK